MIAAIDDSSISANIAHRRTTPACNTAMNDPLPIRAVHHVGRLTKQLDASRRRTIAVSPASQCVR